MSIIPGPWIDMPAPYDGALPDLANNHPGDWFHHTPPIRDGEGNLVHAAASRIDVGQGTRGLIYEDAGDILNCKAWVTFRSGVKELPVAASNALIGIALRAGGDPFSFYLVHVDAGGQEDDYEIRFRYPRIAKVVDGVVTQLYGGGTSSVADVWTLGAQIIGDEIKIFRLEGEGEPLDPNHVFHIETVEDALPTGKVGLIRYREANYPPGYLLVDNFNIVTL